MKADSANQTPDGYRLGELEQQVALAQEGDRKALETVVRAVQRDVHALALRFLWHPEDAEDATQDILIRLLTNLGSYRGESAFRTWMYRLAANALLTRRKQRMEQATISTEEFIDELDQGIEAGAEPAPDPLMVDEVRVGCTLAMLLCLDRKQRLAYILGDILELDHQEAASVLECTRATYRKRLSRARVTVLTIMKARCGLFDTANPCRCHKRVNSAVVCGHLNPEQLLFATSREQATQFPAVLTTVRRLEENTRAAALYRAQSGPEPTTDFVHWVRDLINTGELHSLDH